MSKQIKSSLKTTKQLIQTKEYGDALIHCKEILEIDAKNYNGLVFAGLCYAELRQKDESRSAYHDAIEAQPDQLLAYQGLVNLYVKHWVSKLSEENTKDLIFAYEALLRLNTDSKKLLDLQVSLSKAYLSIHEFSESIKILNNASQRCGENNLGLVYNGVVECLKLSRDNYETIQDFSKLILNSVQNVCKQSDVDGLCKEDALRYFILFLQRNSNDLNENLLEILSLCFHLVTEERNKCDLALEILVQIYLQNESIFTEDMLISCENHFGNYDGHFEAILNGIRSYEMKKYDECVDLLVQGIDICSDYLPARLYLSKAYLRMHKYNAAESTVRLALQHCKVLQTSPIDVHSSWLLRLTKITELKLDLTLCLADALCGSNNKESIKLAIGTYEKLATVWPTSHLVHVAIAVAYIKLEDYEKAKSSLENVDRLVDDDADSNSWNAYIRFKEGDRFGAITLLETIVESHPTCFNARLLLGKCMWETDVSYRVDKTKCCNTFLKAAKLDVFNGETFLYLGHYYRDVGKDITRATKCYEKAYNLEPGNELIGCALADQYLSSGNIESAISLYESITSVAVAGTCRWAWLRLGLCRLKNNEPNTAIKCFLAALRSDMNDYICWECLGEAYLNRGSFTASWKAFNRAYQLQPTSVYSIYQMAAIKQILTEYTEAILEYNDVLKIKCDYVPALKGLGESHLSLAKAMLCEGRDLTCVDHINEAVKYLTTALNTRGDMACIWKLLGDCFTIVHPLDGSTVKLLVSNILFNEGGSKVDGITEISKLEALQLGGKAYAQSLRLYNDATLWHDMGLNYFHQSQNHVDENVAAGLAAKSLSILQKAVSLEPENEVFWNSVGVIAACKLIKNFALAQHCFIKSLKCEPNNAQAWSNLGMLYLAQSQIELAHKAYKTAQSLDPSFVNSWIGQALIAESIDSEEAMDLFRHSTELGARGEGTAGYAVWVCNVVSQCKDHSKQKYKDNIHNLNALSASVCQLSKYCGRNPDCAWASSLYGFVLEKSGLNWSAEVAYKQSLDLLKSRMNPLKGDTEKQCGTKVNRAKSDFARLLWKNGKYSESVEMYQSISPLANFQDICGLALSFYKCGKLKDAYSAFEQANQLASSDDDRILATVAMAVLSWRQKNKNKAKDMLESCGNHNIETVQVLCALGIVERDVGLVQSVIEDLILYDMNNKKLSDVTINNCLLIIVGLIMIDRRKAGLQIQKYIHRYPGEWTFRHLMSQFLQSEDGSKDACLAYLHAEQCKINYEQDESNLSTNCDITDTNVTKYLKNNKEMLKLHAISCLAGGKHVFNSSNVRNSADSLKVAQRLVHCHPYCAESWAVLSGACHVHTVYTSLQGQSKLSSECQRISSFVSDQSETPLNAWAVKQNMMSCLIDHKNDAISDLASQVFSDFEEADAITTLSNCVAESRQTNQISQDLICELENIPRSKSATSLSKNLVIHAYQCLGKFEEAHALLSEALQGSSDRDERLQTALRMSYLAMEGAEAEPMRREEWSKKALTSWNVANNIIGNSPIVQLLEGLIHKLAKNNKKMRFSLSKVLNNPKQTNDLCASKMISAWHLYKLYHEKNDSQEMQKLLQKLEAIEGTSLDCIKKLLPFS